jgi:uncharacterized protein YukE
MIPRYRHLHLPAQGYFAAGVCLGTPRPPGSSAELRAVARALSRTAQALRDTLGRLQAISTDESVWTGTAADAFRSAVKAPPKSHVGQVPERYDGYARQLQAYASALDEAQTDHDLLRCRVTDAVNAYRTAKAGGQSTESAEQSCRAAAVAFRSAHNRWVDAANSCADGLKRVDAHDKLHNPHGIHAAVDAVAATMNELSSVSAVLALVVLPVQPELAVVLLAISTGASIAKLGADGARVAYGEDVGRQTFALDALGSIPVAGSFKGAAAATRQARVLEGVGPKLGGAARAFGKHLGRDYRRTLVRNPVQALRDLDEGGGVAASARRTSWRRFRESLTDLDIQDLLGLPAAGADDA